ncbi:MAG: hypothetical protein C0412_14820 [Flavobacterium sp.]|nr:hypothetical protein [Flavobacterium sp.]
MNSKTKIIIVVLVAGVVLIGGWWIRENYQTTGKVFITTDKTEYTRQDKIRIKIENNLTENICFSSGYPFSLQEKKEKEWESYPHEECKDENRAEKCFKSGLKAFEIDLSSAREGLNRIAIPVCIDCKEGDEFKESKTFYSNEFKIKVKPPIIDFYSCGQDSDCISVKNGCCSCNQGGKTTGINKNLEKEWNSKLSKECRGILCPQVISNDPSCFKEPKCVNNKCVLEEKEKEVVIATDKTEYAQGEIVEIKIRNNLDKRIQVSGPPHFTIEKLENGKWIQLEEHVGCPCEAPNCQLKIMGPWRVEPKSEILLFKRELKIKTGCEGFETLWWEASSGRYKISAEIIINETKETIYSNEFTIKEKTISLATEDVFVNRLNYIGQKFRFQGCFEPHKCTMATSECNIDNLGACCDCIKNYDRCLIVDLQSAPKEKLREVRETNETKYFVEVVGTVIVSSRMRPVAINATDLIVLGDCEEGVAIATDKTEYEQGETVKIMVTNNLDKNICFGTCNNYYFEKKNGEWKYYLKKFCEADFIEECIKPNETKIFERETIWDSYKIEKGTYRVVIPLCIDCENLKNFREDKVIYSNEFTIKEK